jgi:arabinose-5-phosphate isomerase
LGIVRPGGVVIAISYSGSTEEILALTPALKHREAPIIAITGIADSELAKLSAIHLLAQIEKEACPLNLAPTTSIIAALGIADALAIGVMLHSNYQAEQFAVNHPAGRLGRQLTLRIRDMIGDGRQADYISPDWPFSEVLTAITANKMGAVCVGDSTGRLIGIITDGDIRRALQQRSFSELESMRAESIMTASPTITYEDCLAVDALNEMEQRKSQISVLPVVNEDMKIRGMVRVHDLVRAGI